MKTKCKYVSRSRSTMYNYEKDKLYQNLIIELVSENKYLKRNILFLHLQIQIPNCPFQDRVNLLLNFYESI